MEDNDMDSVYCDIYINDELSLHIEGKYEGCIVLQNPELIDEIKFALDEIHGIHYIIYPSNIDNTFVTTISNALSNGKKLKSRMVTSDYEITITLESVRLKNICVKMSEDNQLIMVNVFIMANSLDPTLEY